MSREAAECTRTFSSTPSGCGRGAPRTPAPTGQNGDGQGSLSAVLQAAGSNTTPTPRVYKMGLGTPVRSSDF